MPTPDLDCEHPAIDARFLYAFDLIELNGDDLRRDPLEGRKAIFDLTRSINRACASVGLSALDVWLRKKLLRRSSDRASNRAPLVVTQRLPPARETASPSE
jgi:hypothetical protein